MNQELYYEIFEEFKKMCPWASDKVAKWYSSGELEIIVELKDGSAIQYDYILKSFRSAPSIGELNEMRSPTNEERWRREFSIRLYRTMRLAGLTQDELAWKSGISGGSITKYMNGLAIPSVYNARKLAAALNCDVNYLVDF